MKNKAGHQEMDVINLNNFKPDWKKNFQKSNNHFKILGAIRATLRKFHSEVPHIC